LNKGLLGKVSFFSLLFILTIIFIIALNASLIKAGGGGPKNPCNQTKFCFADAFNTGSNESIVICAGTNISVNWFNIWYNGTQLNDTNGGILSKQYYNYNNGFDGVPGAPYNNGPLNKNTDPFCVLFVLNGDNASFTNKTIQINGTAYNKTNYVTECDPGGCNGTMFTINYFSIETKNAAGSVLPNTVFMAFDNSTKTFIYEGPAMTDSQGYWAEHCIGIVNQSSGACVNATPLPGDVPNSCWTHGIDFPVNPPPEAPQCLLNQTTAIRAFDFISSNTSQGNASAIIPLVLTLSTEAAAMMIMPNLWSPDIQGNNMNDLNVSEINVTLNSNLISHITSSGGQEGGKMPAFIEPYKVYNISFNYGGTNYIFPFMTPTNGMTGAQIFIVNTSSFGPSDYRTFIGKVVNETQDANGNRYPVAGAVVYAQFFKGPSGGMGITFFNSSVTDSNGIFSIRVPRSREPSGNNQGYFPTYQFYIVSNQTNSGVPIYFPTINNNNNRGYFAIGDNTVLPPLTLKAGGEVVVNVTLNNATMILSELNKFTNLGTGVIRGDTTGKNTMTSMFSSDMFPVSQRPTSINIPLLSPTGSVVVNLFGKNTSIGGDPMAGSIVNSCFNTTVPTVTQGVKTSVKCSLAQPGYLNLTVWTCQNIFAALNGDYSQCDMNMRAGRSDFWFEMNGVLRNSSGYVVGYLSQEGILLENLAGFGANEIALRIPLPPGNYTLELASPFEYSRYLNVYNKTAFAITAGSTTILNLTRGNSWNIQPMFNPSFTLSGNNPINVSVSDSTGNLLNNSFVSLTGKILLLNKSNATSSSINFNYDSDRKTFYNLTFNMSSFNLNAGKYLILLNATNTTNGVSYTTLNTMPIHAYDFQVGTDFGGFTFGTGQTISGKIFAYNTSTSSSIGLNSTANNTNVSNSNVTATVYDESGAQVTSVSVNISNITNGQGSLNITLPSTLGFYEIVTTVKTDHCFVAGCTNNAVGVSDNWVQISNLNIKMTTDKQNYQSTDNVVLTVQVSNATNGSSIQGASVEVVADSSSTPAMATTGSDGKATITLNASTHSGSTSWSNGWHNLKVKISKRTDTDVIKLDSWYGFDVRGFDLFLRPDKPSYGATDNVTITAYGQTQGISISGVKVDGTTLAGGGNNICPPIPNVTFCTDAAFGGDTSSNIRIGNWPVGHHNVEITVSSGGGQQKFYTGFDVSNFNIIATTDRFSYDLNQNITLNIKASYINGTVLSGVPVAAVLMKAQPPNDIYVTISTGNMNSSGQATLKLNATQPGFNYIAINVSNQFQYIGVQVSSLKVNLLNSTRDIVTNYYAVPGSSVTIYINATSGGNNVPNGSTVSAKLWSFGNSIDLPTNTTTNGNATITFSISSSAPAQMYGLEVRITTTNGEQGFAQPATLTVTGGSALQLAISADRSFSNPYKIGDTAILSASFTYSNGTGVEGYSVTFEVGSEGSRSQTIGTAVTGSGGTATKTFAISNNYTDGPYFVHAYLTDNTDVQAYSGFMISSLKVDVMTNKNSYAPGENITLNLTVTNRTSGSQVNVTSMFVILFNKDKGEINNYFTPSGAQPYRLNLSMSNESGSIGTYPMAIVAFVNQSQGVGFTMIDVKNASQSLNLSLPSTISAGSYFLANISSSLNGTATLRIFSPTASNVVYENTSISLSTSGTPNATVNMTISNPGVYVFNAFVSGIGTTTQIVTVSAPLSGTIPAVWTGTASTNSTSTFTTSDTVYVRSNIANATATILTVDTTTNTTISASLPLTLNSSTTYYGTLGSSNLASGRKYFVRLDTSTSTGIVNTMFMVS
jgi:hypothetical protein